MKNWSAGIQSVLAALASPKFAVLVSFSALGVRYTNHRSAISYGGQTYSPANLVITGLGENMLAEAPGASLELQDLDGTERARFLADSFRGETVTVRILYDSSGSWVDPGWAQTLSGDVDEVPGAEVVRVRLGSMDAVQGTEVPRRTTQQYGCQHDFMGEGCPFRWRAGMSAALRTCRKTIEACNEHFPDVTAAGITYVVPKPFGGFLGSLPRRLVVG